MGSEMCIRDRNNISYIEDVKANAKGFEYLAKAFMISKSRRGVFNG